MDKLVSVAEMKQIEAEANEMGLSYERMMENAGKALAEAANKAYSQSVHPVVLGLVGSGNNGGDTMIALSELARQGWKVKAYLVKKRSPEDRWVEEITQNGGEVEISNAAILKKWISEADLILDGVLGTGIKLPLTPEISTVLGSVQEELASMETPPEIIAVDCPSGVDCDTGDAAEETLAADSTVCMAAVKKGLLAFPAYELAGEIQVVDIGFSDELPGWKAVQNFVVQMEDVLEKLPPRPADAHKGTFGTAMIVAGSVNYTGAALLAGEAAYRIGTGLVTMAVPAPLHTALAGQLPEATWLLLPHEMGVIAENADTVIKQNFGQSKALLLGPGWGQEDTTFQFLNRLVSTNQPHKRGEIGFVHRETPFEVKEQPLPPLVIDADGLKLLAKIPEWPKKIPAGTVLTPHPGEMSVLTGLSVEEILKNRLEVARKYSQQWGQVVILKGAFTVIAQPGGQACVIPVATAALARAGTGDVLAGIVTGLCAQGMDGFEAAYCGAWIHAQCGLQAEAELGSSAPVLAGDVLAAIPIVLEEIQYS
ncbi:MAG TPA: NAD(P)H-hydrate dehydratase [Anaerolineaceae bacterium]|nr:NAD(P)H-hydrate dehydratase [Anaerolineaceae bacterium]